MLTHGLKKIIDGHDYVIQTLVDKGLPEFLWLGVPVTEALAPALIILGVFTRISGLMVSLVMVIAVFLSHSHEIFAINPRNGALAIELNLLFIFCGIALFFTGGGKYSLYRPKNDWLK